jgi:hypothetical protein
MDTTWLTPVTDATGPLASVHLDVTRTDASAAHEVELRWHAVEEQLRAGGAPDGVVAAVRRVMLRPSGLPGEHGRSVFAGADGVVLERVLPRRPLRDSASYGLVPHLMPVVRALAGAVPYALVEVDRTGADVSVVDAFGVEREEHEVVGDHDVLHKFGGGGWSHKRFQLRVEDSWERNATAVARDLDRLVGRERPALVVLAGDAHARGYVHSHASGRLAPLLVDVEGGGRADGVSLEALTERVEAALSRYRLSRMGDVLARFEQEHGRSGLAAAGLPAVVEALREGAVDTLLLADDPSSTARLWAGRDPLQLGTAADDVRALGSDVALEERADAVLLRALVAQRGQVELVEGAADVLPGGIGALLRFDASPPVPGSA